MMARQAARGVLGLVLVAAVMDSSGRGQPPAGGDRVYYRDKKDGVVRNFEGTLKATPAGYLATKDGKDFLLSPADILSVVPGGAAPGIDRAVFDEVVKQDTNKEWEKVRPQYDLLKKGAAGAPEKFRRFLEYRIAAVAAKAADNTPDDAGWDKRADEAAKLLTDYLAAHPNGWEQWPAAKTAARLQEEAKQPQEAARTWARLAKATDLPPDLRQEAAFQEAEALIRAKRYPDAAARVADALKAAPAGPAKDRLTILEKAAAAAADKPLEGVAQIEAEVAKTKDPGTRAAGHAMIGELYLIANRPRDAMWSLLWVEVVYNQDRDEVAKALARLAEVFALQGDPDRAASYRTKLRQFRAGL